MAFLIIAGLIAALVITFAVKGFVIIKQAETMVIERLGRYNRTLESGINVIWPLLDKPREIIWKSIEETLEGETVVRKERRTSIDLRETVYDFPQQEVITEDNVVLEINALLYFQITDPAKAVYEIANLPDAIEKLTKTTLRNVIGEMDLDATLTSRDTINKELRLILDEATDKWGVKVNRVELQDITPPEDIKEAMEKQMRAERDRRAAILEAEGTKRSKILEAEGVREAKINEAEGEAEARVKVAQAEAEAISRVTESLSTDSGDPANYLIAVKYIQALQEMVSGKDNKVVYLPYEATGILSSIGGIKDMLEGIKKRT